MSSVVKPSSKAFHLAPAVFGWLKSAFGAVHRRQTPLDRAVKRVAGYKTVSLKDRSGEAVNSERTLNLS